MLVVEEYAEFLQSPIKPEKIKPPRKRNNKQEHLPKKCFFNSSEYITVNPVDIENIIKTKWIVVLERIDINICGTKAECLKNDKLVPDLKTNIHNVEDDLRQPVLPTTNYEESAFTSHIDQSQSLYESIFSLIDTSCKENISTKDPLKDAYIKGRNAHFQHVGNETKYFVC